MTGTTTISFADIAALGTKRVDDVTTVDVPALGGSVRIRQISGAEQDAAVAAGHAADGGFNSHVVAREQIKASLVEPSLPDGEADALLDNLPVQAFGQLQSLVQANSGLLGVGVEEMAAMFRRAAGASGADADGGDVDHAGDADVAEGVGPADAAADDGDAGILPSDDEDAGDGGEATGEGAGASLEAEAVTA